MQKRVLLLMLSAVVGTAFGSDNATIRNSSSFDIEGLVIKVRSGRRTGKVRIAKLAKGQSITLDLVKLFDEPEDASQEIEILKIKPKECKSPLTGSIAKCRGRLKPGDKSKRVFTIYDEQPGAVKATRGQHALEKGKKQFGGAEPRLVTIQ